MNVIRVTKEFHFEMAHALHEHDGPCKHIHGHSYQLSVTVKGKVLDASGNPKNGMVVDFSEIKSIVHEQIISRLDHALLLKEDVLKNIPANDALFGRVIRFPYTPTCENMLVDFVARISSRLSENISLCSMKLRETPTSYAEWFEEDNK